MNLIKKRRTELGYSQTEFADKLGVTNDWLSRLENNKAYPSRKLALKISKELNVDFTDIFFNQQSNKKS